MLKLGQVVRYDKALWRVDYVNDCRARLVPLVKRHIEIDGHAFEGEQRGVNVSPNSFLEVVEDLERARDELELAAAERQLAQAQAALARATTPVEGLKTAPTKTTSKATGPERAPPVGWRWHRVADQAPECKDLKKAVLDFVAAHAGATTKEVAAAMTEATGGAVAACLDRFHKAGILQRVGVK